jgi:hypothetical protein
MRIILVAAFAVLSLTTSCAPAANRDNWGRPASTIHQGPYDNTGHGGNQGGGGGGG